MGKVAGGRRPGARYLDNLDLVLEADLEQIAGWTGAQLHVYGLYNNGRSISDLAGDVQAVSNIETGVRALRLYEAWIDQKIGDAASIKLGRRFRSEEHTSELQSLMRISYAVFCLKKKTKQYQGSTHNNTNRE